VDAVYINLPLNQRFLYIRQALQAEKHVLTEFPFSQDYNQAKKMIDLAIEKNVVLMEGLKTAYCPAFCKLISLVKSGLIGKILNVEARFTQILGENLTNQVRLAGGSVTSLGAYPLLAIFKLFGTDFQDIQFLSHMKNGIDIFTKMNVIYENAIASGTVAINAKSEGNLVITGTKGYVYVPAPWWKTELFEVRYEDINRNNKYFYKFEGEGLRYELVEFVRSINEKRIDNIWLTHKEILAGSKVMNLFLQGFHRIEF
jgi:predicted dehydrogenase